jgi:hypothetical protein
LTQLRAGIRQSGASSGGKKGSCEMKLPQHGAFLLLVRLHALKDVGKNANRGGRVGTCAQLMRMQSMPLRTRSRTS